MDAIDISEAMESMDERWMEGQRRLTEGIVCDKADVEEESRWRTATEEERYEPKCTLHYDRAVVGDPWFDEKVGGELG